MRIEEIIENEKRKLKLPEDFKISVYEKFSEPFVVGSCLPEIGNGKLVGVRIKISEDLKGLWYLNVLLHELYHAYEYWKFYSSMKKEYIDEIDFWKAYETRKSKLSELRADFYALRRSLYYLILRKNRKRSELHQGIY